MAEPDFSGWATKNGLKCADGRTIMGGAFKHQDKLKVPLVWQHQHNDPTNVLGHAILFHRPEGVYTQAYFNNSAKAIEAKEAVQHGDVESLSIYANRLKETSRKEVTHGDIKEVSLVLSGANPGALIDNVYLRHGDSVEMVEGEAIMYFDQGLELAHSSEEHENMTEEVNVQEFLEGLDDEQQDVAHSLLHSALTGTESDLDPERVQEMFHSLTEDQESIFQSLVGEALEHAEEQTNERDAMSNLAHAGEKTVNDVLETFSEEQKNVLYFLIGQAVEDAKSKTATHADIDPDVLSHAIQEGLKTMPHLFEQNDNKTKSDATLSHADLEIIMTEAKKPGTTLKEAFLSHAESLGYGIDDIDVLFPDAKTITSAPDVIGRRTEWVAGVLGGSKHTPFSRIKSTAVDITADEARAKGYVKGTMKKDEIIKLTKRVTLPTTIYKKQKLDRDDVIDIVDLDVVVWIKAEMRVMLDEEIARAVLIGDGREPDDEDKINEECVRPIAHDNDMYSHTVNVPANIGGEAIVESVLRARTHYKGTGTPTMYTTDLVLTDLILLKDKIGRRLYTTEADLAAALRVDKIVVVEAMETQPNILAIIVNIADYTIGADKGGQISMFDDFDIDYNQLKFLIETRISGCLTKPKSAVVLKRSAGTVVTAAVPAYNPTSKVLTVPDVTGVAYYDVTSVTEAGTLLTAGNKTLTKTTEVEARPLEGYTFAHNTDNDWTFAVPSGS